VNSRRPSGTAPLEIAVVPKLMVTKLANGNQVSDAPGKLGDSRSESGLAPGANEALQAYAALYLNGTTLVDVMRYYDQDLRLLGYRNQVKGLR
jgi:hypothetical protein